MFNDLDIYSDDESILNQRKKKRKECEKNFDVVHSSLDYHTIKVPSMVEYKRIDNYCEKKGEKFLSGSDGPISSLKSISSPVVLRTPQPLQPSIPLPSSECQPFCFFSVEELSLVKVLNNWSNQKVCPIGKVDYNSNTNECYLHSVGEDGSWKILLNVSNLKTNPAPHKLLQAYGILNIHEGKPTISICFVRNLGSIDLPLLVESYKLMQTYVPKSINMLKSATVEEGR